MEERLEGILDGLYENENGWGNEDGGKNRVESGVCLSWDGGFVEPFRSNILMLALFVRFGCWC